MKFKELKRILDSYENVDNLEVRQITISKSVLSDEEYVFVDFKGDKKNVDYYTDGVI